MGSALIRDIALGVVRHLVAAGGAALVADGVLMSSQTNDFEGAALFLAGVGFSIYDKYSRKKGA